MVWSDFVETSLWHFAIALLQTVVEMKGRVVDATRRGFRNSDVAKVRRTRETVVLRGVVIAKDRRIDGDISRHLAAGS